VFNDFIVFFSFITHLNLLQIYQNLNFLNLRRKILMKNLIEAWKQSDNKSKQQQRAFLKNVKKAKNKGVAELAEKTHNAVFNELDCLQCANCCKSIPPIITKSDAKRIAKHLNLNLAQFEAKYLTTDEDEDTVLNTSPCVFLQTDNKCSIYPYRPKACSAYPHTGHYEFLNNLQLHQQNASYCPAVFHIVDRMMKKLGAR